MRSCDWLRKIWKRARRDGQRVKRIKHNDLVPWFTMDHGILPAGYLASCKKFFEGLKQQATSPKPQASSCKLDSWPDPCYRIIKDK